MNPAFDYAAGFGLRVRECRPLQGGANSRVVELLLEDGSRLVAKHYHRSAADSRDRLGAEAAALELLHAHGLDCAPRLVAKDAGRGAALLSHLPGVPIPAPTDADLDQLLDFLAGLRRLSAQVAPDCCVPASEACFSLDELARNLAWRWERLAAAPAEAACHGRMREFLEGSLGPATERGLAAARELEADNGRLLPQAERVLSPSDLGFHNAVRDATGRVYFLDMEYFGWDDPAKTVCDVLLHPGMALSPALERRFVAEAPARLGGGRALANRILARFPLFAVKWCLILLNEFLAADLDRRRFAAAREDRDAACARQLAKATALFATLEERHARLRAHLA